MISRSGPLSIDRFRRMLDRMVKSARLNRDTFLELKEDSTATVQALTVLALAGASFGFAAAIGYNTIGILLGAVLGADVSIAMGIVWVSLTFLIGRSLFGGRSNYWSLARPVFFSTSPGPDPPHHVDPRVANPRRCTSDRPGLDSDFDSDRGERRCGLGY